MNAVNRQAIAALSLIGIFIAVYLSLHRLGMIGTLACGLEGGCATVQSSSWATFLGVPVPFIGFGGYVVLFGVALASLGEWGAGRSASLLLLALATVAFVFSAYLTAIEAFLLHEWCTWCVVSAIIATLIFFFSLPEAGRLRRREVES